MSRWDQSLKATKAESNLLVLFIPSVDREMQPIDQEIWIEKALRVLGNSFGGATAFPKARGVWRDDRHGGRLVYDEPVVIQCYTNESALERHAETLRAFLLDMGQSTAQGAVGLVIDRQYLEIQLSGKE